MEAKQQNSLFLLGESFSPWTKKALWALEQCNLAYEYGEYTPTLSEPGLRIRLRQWSGKVSVPLLFADSEAVIGSLDIARFANATTDDEHLGDFKAIEPWNTLSEAALAEGRTRVVRSMLGSEKSLEESLPTFVPEPMRKPLRFIAHDAVRRLDRKYAHLVKPGALHNALARTRDGLESAGGEYLLGHFSYADICMATVLEVVAPIANTQPPLGPVTQRCWTDLELAAEFEDLVEWRDRLAATAATSYSQFC